MIIQAYTPDTGAVKAPHWEQQPADGETISQCWARLCKDRGIDPNTTQIERTYRDNDTGIVVREGFRLIID
jgi:hypothetical protein